MEKEEFIKVLEDIQDSDIKILEDAVSSHQKIILLGNGGSNSICSHIAQDFTKQLGKTAISFSDPSRLTCYINDYGMEVAYTKFLEHFCEPETLVILISSSGNSLNIFNSAKYCVEKNIKFIVLTGFDIDNKTKAEFSDKALLNLWVNSKNYGVVECAHQAILHMVV